MTSETLLIELTGMHLQIQVCNCIYKLYQIISY